MSLSYRVLDDKYLESTLLISPLSPIATGHTSTRQEQVRNLHYRRRRKIGVCAEDYVVRQALIGSYSFLFCDIYGLFFADCVSGTANEGNEGNFIVAEPDFDPPAGQRSLLSTS